MPEDDTDRDEILGITRCARCGERLNAEVECPFCSSFTDEPRADGSPKWIYLTACFLTSPLSLPFLIRTPRLQPGEKVLAGSGLLIWAFLYWLV